MENPLQARPAPTETPAEAQRSIVDSFRYLEDWAERYQYLIELGRQLPPFPATKRIEANRLHGCQAGVWLVCDCRNGKLCSRRQVTLPSSPGSSPCCLRSIRGVNPIKFWRPRRHSSTKSVSPSIFRRIGRTVSRSCSRAFAYSPWRMPRPPCRRRRMMDLDLYDKQILQLAASTPRFGRLVARFYVPST